MKWYNPFTWIPFTRAGRQTLIYLALFGCGPALTWCIMRTLDVVEKFPNTTGEARLAAYVELAKPLTWSLLIIIVALACFVSIRAIKIGKDGLEAESQENPDGESDTPAS